jgi:hypothetical protein
MSKIAPCLWLSGDAVQAAEFYCSLFPNSAITGVLRYGPDATLLADTAPVVECALAGQRFQALNGGPQFTHSADQKGRSLGSVWLAHGSFRSLLANRGTDCCHYCRIRIQHVRKEQ